MYTTDSYHYTFISHSFKPDYFRKGVVKFAKVKRPTVITFTDCADTKFKAFNSAWDILIMWEEASTVSPEQKRRLTSFLPIRCRYTRALV